MAISDIIVIALIALFGVIGVLIAVKRSLLSLGAFVVAFVIAFFLANVVAEALLSIDGVRSFVIGNSGWSLYTWIYGGLSGALEAHYPIDMATYEMVSGGTPTALGTSFFAPIIAIIKDYSYSAQFTADQGLALYMAFVMFSGIVGVGLFVVIRVILVVVETMIKAFIRDKDDNGKIPGPARAFGLIAGMVKGFAVSISLLILVSTLGGVLFLNLTSDNESPKSIGSDIESSVITKHVTGWGFAARDALFLPNFDMYGRIVEASGLTVKEEHVDSGKGLIAHDLEMYNYFRNLNYYNGDPYTKNADGYGVEPDNVSEYRFEYKRYKEVYFGNVVRAILEYNDAAADKIKEAGTLVDLGMPANKVQTYLEFIHGSTVSINGIWRGSNGGNNSIYVMLENYRNTLERNKMAESEAVINDVNNELISQHKKIIDEFARLQDQYNNISEFFGALDIMSLLPEHAYQIPLTGYVPPPHECDDVCTECGGCLTDCEEPECSEKCEGHDPHVCEDVCTECGGCLTDCEEPECSEKCEGHDPHVCEDVCTECGGCLTDCEEPECSEKCEGHEEDPDPEDPDNPDNPDNPDDPDNPDNPDDPEDEGGEEGGDNGQDETPEE
ncbi:MAG: hypothetical protein J1F39_05480 [Clostridiales bacterium]|nr:hypothetical protein [Clostridiales bacterium]